MTHAEMNELYELYALGVLEPELADEIERHIDDQCEYCREHLASASQLTASLAQIAEPVAPPARLRQRVLAAVRPPKPARNWTFAVIALAAACLALVAFSIASRLAMRNMEQQLASLAEERDQLRSAVQILSRPETRAVEFGRAENVPHGRVLVSRQGGIVFVGSRLPHIASNETFELWLVPATGAPKPAGLFRPNAAGESVNVSPAPVDTGTTKAVAVSIEPRQGSPAPTTKPILIVPLA
jgi:anti-sigma-K factor RskA